MFGLVDAGNRSSIIGKQTRDMKTTAALKDGFTRVELLASIVTVLLLTMVALPSAGSNRSQTRALGCLSNLRHLVFAWQLYATDHDGVLIGNVHGGEATIENPKVGRWASGWLDWSASYTPNTNMALIRDKRYAQLTDYILTEKNVHKCPADTFQSRQQQLRGWHRVRSVVMNATLGEGNAMNGPWSPIYAQVRTMAGLQFPSPADTSVFFDEHPDSINDPLAYPPQQTSWVDIPGNLHGGAGSFSFADGHVELHPWRTPGLRNLRVRYNFFAPLVRTGDPDISWMSYSSQRRSATSY